MLYWRLRQTPRQTLTNDIFHTAESLSRVPFKVWLLGETMTEEMVAAQWVGGAIDRQQCNARNCCNTLT